MADVETPVRDDVEENTDALDESTVSEGGAAETENGEVGEAGVEENGEDEGDGGGDDGDDAEAMDDDEKTLEEMRKRVQEMQEEQERLEQMQEQIESALGTSPSKDKVDPREADARSVYVGNVDYSSTPEELQAHFISCGTINRVTIMCDKFTGNPKGFAYVEFAEEESVSNALVLNESLFKGRQLKVSEKRTNVPGMGPGGRRRRRYRRSYRRPRRSYHYHPYL